MAVCALPPTLCSPVTENVLLYVESIFKNIAHASGFANNMCTLCLGGGGTNRKNPKNVKKNQIPKTKK